MKTTVHVPENTRFYLTAARKRLGWKKLSSTIDVSERPIDQAIESQPVSPRIAKRIEADSQRSTMP